MAALRRDEAGATCYNCFRTLSIYDVPFMTFRSAISRFSIMAPLAGLILVALGLCLAVTSWAEFVAVLRGVTALGCLGLGAVLLLVGASERKARREYREAITSDPEMEAKMEVKNGASESA